MQIAIINNSLFVIRDDRHSLIIHYSSVKIKESINKFNRMKKFQNIYISNLDYTTQE